MTIRMVWVQPGCEFTIARTVGPKLPTYSNLPLTPIFTSGPTLSSFSKEEMRMAPLTLIVGSLCGKNYGKPVLFRYHLI